MGFSKSAQVLVLHMTWYVPGDTERGGAPCYSIVLPGQPGVKEGLASMSQGVSVLWVRRAMKGTSQLWFIKTQVGWRARQGQCLPIKQETLGPTFNTEKRVVKFMHIWIKQIWNSMIKKLRKSHWIWTIQHTTHILMRRLKQECSYGKVNEICIKSVSL